MRPVPPGINQEAAPHAVSAGLHVTELSFHPVETKQNMFSRSRACLFLELYARMCVCILACGQLVGSRNVRPRSQRGTRVGDAAPVCCVPPAETSAAVVGATSGTERPCTRVRMRGGRRSRGVAGLRWRALGDDRHPGRLLDVQVAEGGAAPGSSAALYRLHWPLGAGGRERAAAVERRCRVD